jgi:signal transduction histidine kinase
VTAILSYEEPSAAVLALRPRATTTGLAELLLLEVATAADFQEGVEGLIAILRTSGLPRCEWWAPVDDGRALRLELADGQRGGARTAIPLGPAGALILVGARATAELMLPVTKVVVLLRRRWTEEQLASHVTRLARANDALDDFAALLAHDLKSALVSALRQPKPSAAVADALELVDSILDVVRAESEPSASASVARCLEEALHDLGTIDAAVAASVAPHLPVPPAVLRLLLRNLLGNAVAAGSREIHVSTEENAGHWTLVVDDDGVGLDAPTGYASGSGLGLGLCRRLVARFGGALELTSRPRGGTRATLVLAEATT